MKKLVRRMFHAVLLDAVLGMGNRPVRLKASCLLSDPSEPQTISIVAASKSMPRESQTTVDENGYFSIANLLPDTYSLTFTAQSGAVHTMNANVFLNATTRLNR